MKIALGILLILAGIALGLWLGLWVMFIGGIAILIEVIKTQNFDAMLIAINIAKVLFAGAVGWIAAYIGVIPGWLLLTDDSYSFSSRRRRRRF